MKETVIIRKNSPTTMKGNWGELLSRKFLPKFLDLADCAERNQIA